MSEENSPPKTVSDYIDAQPEATRRTLLALRAIIQKTIPDAQEQFNYAILAYPLVQGGKRDTQIMIAGYKNHVGFYPGGLILEHFSEQLTGYKTGKGSVQFPNHLPLPENLIVAIIQFKRATMQNSSKL